MRRAIILVLDGLRRDMITPELTPCLVAHGKAAETFEAHRSVFPSATRVVSSSLATGCFPSRHELSGNSLVLMENGALVAHDAGHPGFLQHKRRITGRSLAMPTMAERLRPHGGAIIYANVSPGAAYAHDPDGHGMVYHRAGSFGPGRVHLTDWDASKLTVDAAGDRVMAERFIADVVTGPRKPALALMWLAEPDFASHSHPLGSPAQRAAVQASDQTAGRVFLAVERARAGGDDILLVVASDHGHQTVMGVIDIEAELVGAGLKSGAGSGDVVSTSNGTSALVYVHPDHGHRIEPIGQFLRRQVWAGEVVGADDLSRIGLAPGHGLAFAVAMAATSQNNRHGVPGMSYEAKPAAGKSDHMHCGQHGGLARYEQSPFLMLQGPGFAPGTRSNAPTSAVDIAPTVLTHLGVAFHRLDGRALQGQG